MLMMTAMFVSPCRISESPFLNVIVFSQTPPGTTRGGGWRDAEVILAQDVDKRWGNGTGSLTLSFFMDDRKRERSGRNVEAGTIELEKRKKKI